MKIDYVREIEYNNAVEFVRVIPMGSPYPLGKIPKVSSCLYDKRHPNNLNPLVEDCYLRISSLI